MNREASIFSVCRSNGRSTGCSGPDLPQSRPEPAIHPQQTSEELPPHLSECLLWMAPTLQEKFDVLALVGSSLLSGLLMQSTLDCWP
jgi:hypothetical protein